MERDVRPTYDSVGLFNGTDKCYIKEENVNLTSFKKHWLNTTQPIIGPTHQCTMLLLSNLDKPQWLSVNCFEALIPSVACVIKEKGEGQQHGTTMAVQRSTDEEHCGKESVLFNQMCFLFLWIENLRQHSLNLDEMCRLEKQALSHTESNIQVFKYMFDAIKVDQLMLVWQNVKNPRIFESLLLRRLWMVLVMDKKTAVMGSDRMQGWFSCYSRRLPIYQTEITHRCKNNQSISTVFICDGDNDCKDLQNGKDSDEIFCVCEGKFTGFCQEMCVRENCKCSPLFYKDIRGRCLSFTKQITKTIQNKNNKGICNNATLVSSMSCVMPNDDETHKTDLNNDTTKQCKWKNELPCIPYQHRCYNMSDICVYRLDVHNHLTPCEQGSHLEQCQKFQCDNFFKCPEYYCIPWGYLCDGK